MAIIVDACQAGAEWRYRLWDTQAGHYLGGAHDDIGIIMELWHLLGPRGNREEEEDTERVFADWLRLARDRRTSDISQETAAVPKPAWRTPSEPCSGVGPIRVALRRAAVMEQCARAVLDLTVSRKLARLSPDAQAFLAKSYVLQELLRGNGKARTLIDRAKDEYKGIANVRALVAEIAAAWADAIAVETVDLSETNSTVCTFRLR